MLNIVFACTCTCTCMSLVELCIIIIIIIIIYSLHHTGCCIYTKPHRNGDDSDTSDDDGDWDDCCHEHKVARQRVPHSK